MQRVIILDYQHLAGLDLKDRVQSLSDWSDDAPPPGTAPSRGDYS